MIRNESLFASDLPAGFDGQFHWDYLVPALQRATGRNIQPMDIDCHIEINGQHLIFETKAEGVPIPDGQKKALLELWAKGDHLIIFMWGKVTPMRLEVFYPGGGRVSYSWSDLINKHGKITENASRESVAMLVERWAEWATKCRRSGFQYNGVSKL